MLIIPPLRLPLGAGTLEEEPSAVTGESEQFADFPLGPCSRCSLVLLVGLELVNEVPAEFVDFSCQPLLRLWVLKSFESDPLLGPK
jgi:hypothetical protein